MATWSVNLEKYAKVQKKHIKDVRRVFTFMLYDNIVMRTPVDTGRARGNWNVSTGTEDSSTSERTTPKFTNFKQIPEAEGDQSYFITNNLPYIKKLEYGGYPKHPKNGSGKTVNGYSRQAPNGMVGVTVAGVNDTFERACEFSEGSNE